MTRHRYKQGKATRGGSPRRSPAHVGKLRQDSRPRGDRVHNRSEKKKVTKTDLDYHFLYPDTARFPQVPNTWTRPADLPAAKAAALEGIRRYGVLVWACRASGIGRRVVYELFKEDPAWKKAMEDARRECFEDLEASMIARGHYVKGDLAGIFTLKHNNKKYREVSRVEVSGPGGAPIVYEETRGELLSRLGKLTQSLVVDAEVRTLGAAGGGSGRPALVPAERPIIRKLKKGA